MTDDTTTLDRLIEQGFSKTILYRFWNNVTKNGRIPQHAPHLGNCWEWTGFKNRKGYGRLGRGIRQTDLILAHRLSWIIHANTIPDGKYVLHKCDNPACVRPDHLWIGSKIENNKDMRLKKRHAFGERAGHAKLSSEEVGEIRFIWNNYAVLQKTLARGFGVGPNTISRIVHGVRRSLG